MKNHALSLRAAAPLLVEGCGLVLVGDGPERPALEGLARELGLGDRLHLLGYRSDVARLLQGFDCFVMSSHTEGLPLVLIEAMATGLAVVSTAVGGIPVAVGDAGLLVDAGDELGLRGRSQR